MNHQPSPQADGHAHAAPSEDDLSTVITNAVLAAHACGLTLPDLISVVWDGWDAYEQALGEHHQAPVDRITG